MLLSRKSVCLGIAYSEVWTGTEFHKKMFFFKSSEFFSLFFNGLERVSLIDFFLRLIVRNEILKCFSLQTKYRSSESFSILRNGLEWNCEHFIFLGIIRSEIYEFPMFFSSMKWYTDRPQRKCGMSAPIPRSHLCKSGSSIHQICQNKYICILVEPCL